MKTGKRIFLLAMLAIMNSVAIAQVTYNWAYGFGGTAVTTNTDGATCVATDASGNVYVGGFFRGTSVNFDPAGGGLAPISSFTSSSQDAFIAKYNSSGQLLKVVRIWSAQEDQVNSIAIDGNGYVYVVGYAKGTVTLEQVTPFSGIGSNGAGKWFVAKYDANLNLEHDPITPANPVAFTIGPAGGTTSEVAYDIAVDGSNNIVITGSFSGTSVDFDPHTTNTAPLTSNGSSDIFIARYTSSLTYLDAINIGGASADVGNGIDADASGNVYVTGKFIGNSINFNPKGTSLPLTEYPTPGSGDAYVAQYNSSLNCQWAFPIGASVADEGRDIRVTSTGVYVSGYFSTDGNGTDFNLSGASGTLMGSGSNDGFIAKYTTAGAYLWATKIGGTAADQATRIGIDASETPYVTGYIANGISGSSNADIFFNKYDITTGTAILTNQVLGGTFVESGAAICVDANSNILLVGTYTSNPCNMNPSGTANLTGGNGPGDAFIARYTQCIAPTIGTQPTSTSACIGGSASFTVAATGTGTLTYSWRKGGSPIGVTTPTLTIGTIAAGDAGSYDCVVTGTCSPQATSDAVTLTVNTAPSVTTQPTATSACVGGSASFTAAASGTGVTYSWRKGGTPIGVTTATLTINPVAAGDAGNYDCLITGTCTPNATTNSVALTVNTAPSVTTQPTATSACVGGSASFTAAASGTGVTYLWRKGGTPIGVTTATLTINPVAAGDAGNYDCLITGTCTPNATTNSVALTVNTAPSIGTQPTATSACVGGSASFTVSATGTGLTYSWRKGGTPIGVTTATLTINPVAAGDAGNYDCVVSGTCSPSATSNSVALTINTAPSIGTQPSATSACVGGSASFTVAATGTGLTYSWRKGGTPIGVTTATLTINPVAAGDAGNYDCVVSGTCSPSATSNAVALTVNTAPSIGTQPSATSACVGGSASFTVVASGSGLTYLWRRNGSSIGVTTATLTINPVAAGDAGNYDCVVTGTCAPSATSNAVALTVNTAPSIGTQPTATSACVGGSASFTVSATGTGLTYSWRKGGTPIGVTTATLTINPVAAGDAGNYDCVVSGTCSPSATSNSVALTVNTAPSIGTQPSATSACVGGSASFTVVASGTGLTYSWRKGGTPIGVTTATLTINPVAAGDAGNYDCVVSGTCSPSATSNAVALTVNTAPSIGTQPSASAVCSGGTATFTVVASGSGLTYKWRKGSTNLDDGGDLSGTNTATLSIANVDAGDVASNYNCVITGTCTPAVTTNNVALSITSGATVTTQPTNQTVCPGATATFSVVAGGSGLTYQWKQGVTPLSDGGDISGANTASLSIANASAGDVGSYSVEITATCGAPVTSNTVTLSLNTVPAITGQPSATSACVGTGASFSVTATGTGVTYAWRKGGTPIGVTTATLNIGSVAAGDAGNYDVVVSGTCTPSVTSNSVALVVNTAPAITTHPLASSVCSGATATFEVVATGTGLTYQWRKGTTNLVEGGDISGSTSATVSIANVDAGDVASNYNCVVTGTCSPAATSNNAALSITTGASITTHPASQSICVGQSVTFTVASTGSGLTYQWRKNGDDINLATASSYTIPAIAVGDAASYTVIVTASCGSPAISNPGILSVNTAPSISTHPSTQTLCAGSALNLSVLATGTSLTYQWKLDGDDIGSATSSLYSIGTVGTSHAGSYTVVVSGICGTPVTSNAATITVNTLPSIATQPVSTSVCSAGQTATFTVVASGTGVAYVWNKNGSPLSNGGNISGATSATLTISNVSAGDVDNYSVTVSGTCTPSVTSNTVALSINSSSTTINTHPVSQSLCTGDDLSLAVTATGSSLTYQWKKDGLSLSDGGSISGSLTSNLTITNVGLSDDADYTCDISSSCAPLVSTNAAVIIVTVCTGTSDALATDMILSPNPTSGYFELEAKGIQDGYISIVITNSLGTEVWRGMEYVSGGELRWSGDISELTSGVYHVQIISGDKITSRRVIKK